MTVATQLEKLREQRIAKVQELPQEIQAMVNQPPEPIKDYYDRSTRSFTHLGYTIRREGDYQLWKITLDGREVTGLHGQWSQPHIAIRAIDQFLKREAEMNNRSLDATAKV